MKVIVDGIADLIQVDSEEMETLEDFFSSFKEFVSENDKIVSTITVDGYEMTQPFVDDIFEKPITAVSEIKIETIPVKDLCMQTLDEVEKHLLLCSSEFKKASEIIYSQKFEEAANLISRAIQKWRFCQQALDSITNILINRKIIIDQNRIKSNYKDFEEVILQLSESLQNNDFMMVKDVIDYELLDKLEFNISLKDELKSKLISEF